MTSDFAATLRVYKRFYSGRQRAETPSERAAKSAPETPPDIGSTTVGPSDKDDRGRAKPSPSDLARPDGFGLGARYVSIATSVLILVGMIYQILPADLFVDNLATEPTPPHAEESDNIDEMVTEPEAVDESAPAEPPVLELPPRTIQSSTTSIPLMLDINNRYAAMLIQRKLVDLGFYNAKPDGMWGSGSQASLNRFRRDNALVESTDWDLLTQIILFSLPMTPTTSDTTR